MMRDFDIWLFHFLNGAIKNPFLDALMPLITFLGDRNFAFLLCALFLILWKRDKKRFAIILLTSLLVTIGLVELLKHIINRPRPVEVLTNVIWTGNIRSGLSFPSAHTAVGFVLASALSSAYKKLLVPLFFIATLVAISRIYLGVHYPSDVLAGAAIGTITAYAVTKILDKFNRI